MKIRRSFASVGERAGSSVGSERLSRQLVARPRELPMP